MQRIRRTWIPMSLCLLGLQLVPGAAHAREFDRSVIVSVDPAGRVMPGGSGGTSKRYWADPATNSVRRSNLDGSAVEDVVTGLNLPYGLSLDPSGAAFLWTSSGDETVQKLATDGGSPVALQSEFEEPFAIELPAQEGSRSAYAVLDGTIVKITQLDNSDTDQIDVLMRFDPASQPVHGLALDPKAGILYVGNLNGQMTQRIRLADNQVETLSFVEGPVLVLEPTAKKKGKR
jgi:hypothetical protein